MALKAYHITPIDFGWLMLPTVPEFAARIAELEAQEHVGPSNDSVEPLFARFLEDFRKAQALASDIDWEGDFATKARVFLLPCEVEIKWGFAWKQSNNGSTFVISPEELPHLDHVSLM